MKGYNFKIVFTLLLVLSAGTAFTEENCREIQLAPSEKKLIDTFFSNFSEVFLKPFDKEGITDSEMIQFGVMHNYRNNGKRFIKGEKGYQVKIKASFVDESVEKFFGRKIGKHQPVDNIDYKDGWYFITEASGEIFSFSQLAGLCDNGKGLYTATVNIYTAGSGWTGDVHGTAKEWGMASSDDVPELSEVMTATLHKLTEKGRSRYILVDYVKAE